MRTVTSEFERIWISLRDKSLWQHRECNGKILTSVQGRAPHHFWVFVVKRENLKFHFTFRSINTQWLKHLKVVGGVPLDPSGNRRDR